MLKPDPETPSKRSAYHHGNLRDHLISASRALIEIDGPEHFKIADACRHAGVSTAAPYRHFADRKALLDAVAVAGFNDLRDQTRAAGEPCPRGSVLAVSAIGKAYVAFACRAPNLFRLMFGQSGVDMPAESTGMAEPQETEQGDDAAVECKSAGRECYEVLLEQLTATLGRETVDEAVIEASFPLWTFVHGLSFLLIDGNLSVNRMPIDIEAQIDRATECLMPGGHEKSLGEGARATPSHF